MIILDVALNTIARALKLECVAYSYFEVLDLI